MTLTKFGIFDIIIIGVGVGVYVDIASNQKQRIYFVSRDKQGDSYMLHRVITNTTTNNSSTTNSNISLFCVVNNSWFVIEI